MPTSSHSRRVNVRGLLKRHNELVPYLVAGKVDTAVIVAWFDPLSPPSNTKTYGLLANGPLHRSQEFSEQMAKWVKKGLISKYLPPYSPALKLIEIVWRFMQYSWLPFSAYASCQHVVAALEELLIRVGAEYVFMLCST